MEFPNRKDPKVKVILINKTTVKLFEKLNQIKTYTKKIINTKISSYFVSGNLICGQPFCASEVRPG